MARRTVSFKEDYSINDDYDDDQPLLSTDTTGISLRHRGEVKIVEDPLQFTEWPRILGFIFAIAVLLQQVTLPTFVTKKEQGTFLLPFLGAVSLWGLSAMGFILLLVKGQRSILSGKTIILSIVSGILQGIGIILLAYSSNSTRIDNGSNPTFYTSKGLSVYSQVALSSVWLAISWPLAKFLYPGSVGSSGVDSVILMMVQFIGVTVIALGVAPSFAVASTNPISILWVFFWIFGILALWFGRSLIWNTTAKPKTWRDIVTQVFYSSTLQLVTVVLFVFMDVLPQVGHSKGLSETIDNCVKTLQLLNNDKEALVSLVLFVIGFVIAAYLPAKAYLVGLVPFISYGIYIIAFSDIFPYTQMELNLTFPATTLGLVGTIFWGFVESRIRWIAASLRGRLRIKRDNPIARANIFSRLLFCWNVELMKRGFQSKLTQDEVPDVPDTEHVEAAYGRFNAAASKNGIHNGMFRIFVSTFGWEYLWALLSFTIFLGCTIFTPGYLLPNILNIVAPPAHYNSTTVIPPPVPSPSEVDKAYYYVIGLSVSAVVAALGYQHGWHWALRCGIRARVAFIMAVYDKILTVRKLQSVGEVVNFLSSDSSRLIESVRFGWWLILAPISLFVIMGLLIKQIGAYALLGMLVLFMQMPIQLYVGSKIGNVRERAVAHTDERVKIMNDILSSIKTVKLYCWEDSFAQQVADIRAQEAVELSSTATIKFLNVALSYFSPVLATMLSLAVFYSRTKHTADATVIFTVSALFASTSAPLACLPMAIANIAQAYIGLSRLQALLTQEDLKDTRILDAGREAMVRVKKATFAYEYENSELSMGQEDHDSVALSPQSLTEINGTFVLSGVDLHVEERGKLIAIVGRVGSGKSCFLSAIAGQLPALEGFVEVNGKISFMTQNGLLTNSTVRDNILFGLAFDQDHYDRVCEACELTADFKNLPLGDQTEVGEKGATLSGGQKARVGLARAVYADRDIYLLDDPLSAVDSRVGMRIFKKCLRGALRNKITILVTNQPQYLPDCDEIIVLSNGRIVATGTFDQIKQEEDFASLLNVQTTDKAAQLSANQQATSSVPQNIPGSTFVDDPIANSSDEEIAKLPLSSSYAELDRAREQMRLNSFSATQSTQASRTSVLESFDEDTDSSFSRVPLVDNMVGSIRRISVKDLGSVTAIVAPTPAKEETRERATLIADEDASSQRVSLSTLIYYCMASGTLAPILLALFFVLVQVNRITVELYLGVINIAAPPGKNHVDMKWLLLIYAAVVILYFFMIMGRAAAYARVSTNNATAIHNVVFAKVLKAPLSFFESNPLGRILNRFSRDLDIVDGRLPDYFLDAFIFVLHVLSIMILICVFIPWFIFLLTLILVGFGMLITYYQRTARELKSLDAVSSSPIFAHLSVSINGITTIRAYNAQQRFRQDNRDKINVNTRSFFYFEAVTNWLGLCLDLLAAVITSFVGLLTVSLASSLGSFSGMLLTLSLMLTAALQYTVRTSTETENLLVAVQRLKEYADTLTSEGIRDNYAQPPPNWPSSGQIEFRNVVVKYRPELPPVLKSVNFVIKPREKVGIVGRTGAGKSTLIQVLFRLIEPAGGDVLIDGVSIVPLELPVLRRSLACIPQDPVLFVGTIRTNLDPFNEKTDDQLWDALDRVHMKEMIENMQNSLYSPIVEGGINFSLGQRQLICIARAVLRGARILVMDEATAAIDMESDQLIQKTVRSSFQDVTVLTIAHRLATIIDYDRIMVVADGGIAEFEHPDTLLANPKSIFYEMYHSHT